jgi:dynein light intermediate chain 1
MTWPANLESDGASLIYTAPTMITPLQSLVHASLGIHSLLKRSPLKPNTIDRDKIVVPPNWDSWGRIRVLRDAFDCESISEGWSIDINQPSPLSVPQAANGVGEGEAFESHAPSEPEGSAVVMYEEQVQDTSLDTLQLAQGKQDTNKLEIPSIDTQAFLGSQLARLEQQRKDDEKTIKENSFAQVVTDDIISDHIGPVQFNMGGIQVDADDMVQRLKDRQAYGQSPEPHAIDEDTETEPAPQVDTDTLAKFFGNLMNRKPASGGTLGKT